LPDFAKSNVVSSGSTPGSTSEPINRVADRLEASRLLAERGLRKATAVEEEDTSAHEGTQPRGRDLPSSTRGRMLELLELAGELEQPEVAEATH
jgi:hypothetical protein